MSLAAAQVASAPAAPAASPFAEYVRHGLALCPIAPGSKGPRTAGWQRADRAIRDQAVAAKLTGAGLLHAWSRTCAVDVDDLQGAEAWLAAHSVELGELLADDDAVQVRSGRGNRAKLVYRLPAGCDPLPTHKIESGGAVLFELRCASAEGQSVQDVLPPTIHPDTGKPYEWAGAGDWRSLPELPIPLLNLWRSLQAQPKTAGKAPAPGEPIGPGQRNDTLFKIACSLRGNGYGEATILAALQAENRDRCKPPLTDEEVRTLARSAAGRYEAGNALAPVAAAVRMHDAADIMARTLEPVRYVVPGWLTEGLTLLVANPKVGKTTLILQVGKAVASAGEFWGEQVPQAHVLMIDLETNERRLRRKLAQAGIGDVPPGAMKFAFDWPRGVLGVEAIAQALDADPAIRLVVIDTLQRFRDSTASKNAYAADYEALTPLQQLCKERPGLAIVVVHHKRKSKGGDDDLIDSINGSAALAGAADGIWFLGRKGAEFVLNVQARDWEREDDEFLLVRNSGRWELSDAPRFSYSEREVLSLLDKTGPLRTTALADALSITRQAALTRLKRMQGRGQVQFREEAWHALV